MSSVQYQVVLTKEEREVVLSLIQDKLSYIVELGDTRVVCRDLTSLIEIKNKLESSVKSYS
jgi:hypothetical protein